MLISHIHKIVFIAVPKTASVAIRDSLEEYIETPASMDYNSPFYLHNTAKSLKQYFIKNKWNWDEYFKFAFVRNPWDRVVSAYNYRMQYLKKDGDYNRKFKDHCVYINKLGNFDKIVESHLDLIIEPQLNWILDDNKQNLLNYIGRYENLQQDFDIICEKVHIPKRTLRHMNGNVHKNYSKWYNQKSLKIVQEKFKEEIEMFNYKFIVKK